MLEVVERARRGKMVMDDWLEDNGLIAWKNLYSFNTSSQPDAYSDTEQQFMLSFSASPEFGSVEESVDVLQTRFNLYSFRIAYPSCARITILSKWLPGHGMYTELKKLFPDAKFWVSQYTGEDYRTVRLSGAIVVMKRSDFKLERHTVPAISHPDR